MTSEEFVRTVMERLDVQTAAELAEKMRWGRGAERTAARWLTGQSQPSFVYVIDMAERAGLLNTSAVGIKLEPGDDPRAPADREQLAANDAEILENQDIAMKILEAIRDAVVPPNEAARTAPRRSRKRA